MRLQLSKYIGITIALMYVGAMGGTINSSSLLNRDSGQALGLCRIAEAGNITPGMGSKKKQSEAYFGNLARQPIKANNNKKEEYSFEIDTSYKKPSNQKPIQERPPETSIAYKPKPTTTKSETQNTKDKEQARKQSAQSSQTINQASKSVTTSTDQNKPVNQSTDQEKQSAAADKTEQKPVEKPVTKSVQKPAEKPAAKTSAQKPAEKPVTKPASKKTDEKPIAKQEVAKPAEDSDWSKAIYKPVDTTKKPKASQSKADKKNTANKANGKGIGNIPMLTAQYNGIKNRIDEITVGLDGGLHTATVSTVTDYDIYNDSTGQPLGAFKSGTMVTFGVAAGITVNGTRVSGSSIALVPRINGKSGNGRGHGLRFQGTEYRGEIVVELSRSGSLRIFNRVQLDDYVKGVVPSEMSPSWNIEALKAQAVAARTFALYNKKQENHDDGGYDVCETTHCQVYEGFDGEDLASNAAVDATAGQVLMFGGQVIYAPFHASSGGLTENISDLWGSKAPYLKSVYDDDSESPYHNWSEDWTVGELQDELDAASKGVGRLISIGFKTNNGKPDGRMLSATFKGTDGSVTVDGGDMRNIFGLKSSYFTFKPSSSTKSSKGSWNFINVVNSSQHITLAGHGYGHGLGLSQYGAKAMGDKGQNYRQILNHYYIGVEIKQLY